MVEAKPTVLHLLGQGGEAFIDSGPGAEVLEAGRFALFQRLFQQEEAFIVNIVVKIKVGTGSHVRQEEPAHIGQMVFIRFGIYDHRSYGQGGFHEHFGGILAEAGGLGNLRQGHGPVAKPLQDSELDHEPAHLEYNRAEGNKFCQTLRLPCIQMLAGVRFLNVRK